MHQVFSRIPSMQRAGLATLALWALVGVASAQAAAPATASASAPAAKATITEDQATAAALKAVPGKVTGVTIEKKRGKLVYVIEIMTPNKGEKDVFVDRVTGKVIGTD